MNRLRILKILLVCIVCFAIFCVIFSFSKLLLPETQLSPDNVQVFSNSEKMEENNEELGHTILKDEENVAQSNSGTIIQDDLEEGNQEESVKEEHDLEESKEVGEDISISTVDTIDGLNDELAHTGSDRDDYELQVRSGIVQNIPQYATVTNDNPSVSFTNSSSSYMRILISTGDKIIYDSNLIKKGCSVSWNAFEELEAGDYNLPLTVEWYTDKKVLIDGYEGVIQVTISY